MSERNPCEACGHDSLNGRACPCTSDGRHSPTRPITADPGSNYPRKETIVKMDSTSRTLLIDHAVDLLSEHGENPHYDRAIVELTARALGLSDEHYDSLAAVLVAIHPTRTAEYHDVPKPLVITEATEAALLEAYDGGALLPSKLPVDDNDDNPSTRVLISDLLTTLRVRSSR